MKAARLVALKKELQLLEKEELLALVLKITKYKKENKELLTYLLFEAGDEEQYIRELKKEIGQLFEVLNTHYIRDTKKGLRKILRYLDKWVKYSKQKPTEVEIRIYFCHQMRVKAFPKRQSIFLNSFYERQMNKIHKIIATLHEDLQFDYQELLLELKLV